MTIIGPYFSTVTISALLGNLYTQCLNIAMRICLHLVRRTTAPEPNTEQIIHIIHIIHVCAVEHLYQQWVHFKEAEEVSR